MSDPSSNSGGLSKLMGMLNLPDNWLVVAIVLLSGGGNFLTTKDGNNTILRNTAREEDVNKALAEIHQMHTSIDSFEARQKQILALLKPSPTPSPSP